MNGEEEGPRSGEYGVPAEGRKRMYAEHPERRQGGESDERWAARRGGEKKARSSAARRAAILEVPRKGKSLGATQVMEEIEKNPDWEKWGSRDEYYQAMKLGIGSDWFKRGSLYNISRSPKKEEKLTVDPEAIARGDFSSILGH
jgi:hypothetical protein